MAGRVFGLDFGTTNSLLATVQGETCISLVDQKTGRPHPSVVWYRAGEVVVGRDAREYLDSADGAAPEGLLRSPKMSLRRDGPIHLEGKEIAPSDAIKEVLSFLRQDALTPRGARGLPYEVDRVVMTIPVDFQGQQRRQLRDAARKAGFGIVQFVHEPVAALYAYLRTLPDLRRQLAELENRVLLVFDWGGGTLDLTLCRMMGGTLMQIDSAGNNEVGGDVFDERLRNLVRTRHAEQHGVEDITAVEAPGMGAKLLARCEIAKIQLSSEDSPAQSVFVRDYARLEGAAGDLRVSLSLADIERESRSLVNRGLAMIDQMLGAARLDPKDVHLCLPTGGMVNMPAIRSGLVERFGGRVPRLPNGDRIIAEGAAWIAHDELRLTLAKPIEVRVADGTGAGHYHTLIEKGLRMPVENQSVSAANSQFVCADPRNGIAVFEFVKPSRVGLVQATDERETLCSLSVAVNPTTEPLFERLHCEVRLDHDYVAHVQIRSQGRGAVAEAEIHRLDFGLAMLPAPSESDSDGAAAVTGSSPRAAKSQGTARIHGKAGAVAFRPNIVPFDGKTADLRHAVAGDVARIFWPAMFNPDAPERTQRQHEEAMYYTPCSVCGRNAYQIEVEGAGPKCGPRCFQQNARQRLAG
jgi:hypothetical protein